MPIYEYKCRDCGEVISELRPFAKREEPLECPHCDGVAEVILSVFATGKGDTRPGCWTSDTKCGPT